MIVHGPFYNLKEAAGYCGYAPATFARLLRDFDIPRHGPHNTRFASSVLDAWMSSPETFRKSRLPRARRRKPLKVAV